jgi:hypothetical protein
VSTSTKAADHMVGVRPNGGKRSVQGRATDAIEDDVETLAPGVFSDLVVDSGRGVIDGSCAQRGDCVEACP